MNREQWDRDQTMMRIAKALEKLVKILENDRKINKKNKSVE
jgi:hypothetical protein